MTLVSVCGIQTEEFIDACDDRTITRRVIDGLVSQGWIESNDKTISLHSIVSDVISEQNIGKEDSYYSLACYLQDRCDVDESFHIAVLQKALATARQLERRYKTEDEYARATVSYLLGCIFLALYRPRDAERYLKKAVTVLEEEGYETKSCIYSSLMAILTPLTQNSGLLNTLSGNTIELDDLGVNQTIIYLIYPDEKNSLNFVVNMFLTQCYEILVSTATKNKKDRLDVRVNFVLDEFSNLAAISNFENRISEARSKNIRYFLCIQSFSQLENKYKENAETLISNCSNWICFGSKEIAFLSKISEICGKELDYNGIEHYLISPSNIQYLKKGNDYTEVLILRQGLHPYVTELPDYSLLDLFVGVAEEDLTEIFEDSSPVFVSFAKWVEGVVQGRYKFPFPEKK